MSHDMDPTLVDRIVRKVLENLPSKAAGSAPEDPARVIAGVSARHAHLSREHCDALFGPGHELQKFRDLRQPGQYAAKETVLAVTPGGVIEGVRILGPLRQASQMELSMTDARKLRIDAPLTRSGSGGACPPILLMGPRGHVLLDQGVGMAWRHVHLSPDEAAALRLKDGDEVEVEIGGDRGLVFRRVWVRVGPNMLSEFHVDVDEANACGLKTGDFVRILR